MDEKDLADSICKRVATLAGNRGTLEAHWNEIADLILPSYAGTFFPGAVRTQGEKRTDKMVDATGSSALMRFAAAMESMLTPRSSKWHRLKPSDPSLSKDRDTRIYFEEVTNILFKYRYAPKANYASQQHECYMGLGAFGTAALFVDKADTGGLRYRAIHLGQVYFDENHQGLIDTNYRDFKMDARQAVQKWGVDKLPKQIVEAAKTHPDREFEFIHAVMPRGDFDPTRLDAKGKRYASYYVSKTEHVLLSEGGYRTLPYAISRYVQAPDEIYGRSPAMLALPSLKVLNEEKRTLLKQGHRTVDPVLLAHDDGILDTFSMRPGAMNAGGVSAEGRALVHVLPTGNVMIGKEMMDDERAIINDMFLVSLFQILVETPEMTATEVLERAREKGALLSPTMGRQQSEALGPLIERELDLLAQQGLLPPLPPALAEAAGEYEVEYDSPLSRAQKAEEASGFMRTMETALAHFNATQDPSSFDWLDFDEAIPDIADINAVPARWIRSIDAVKAMREGRAQAAQEQQAIEAAPAVAGLAKAAGGV